MSGIALKFTSLLIRTIAKPFANTLKAQAKDNETFRKAFIRMAQTLHQTDVKLRMRLLGETKIKVRPLNDNKAIENGATFVSEAFIFSVAGSLILYESIKSRKKSAEARDALADDIATLQDEIEYIKRKLKDYHIKLDDYQPLADYKPKYVKLDGGLSSNEPGNNEAKISSISSAGGDKIALNASSSTVKEPVHELVKEPEK